MTAIATGSHTDDEVLLKEELAKFLKCSERKIDYMVKAEQIPYFKMGKSIRFVKRLVLEELL